jgi:hypothetical protein
LRSAVDTNRKHNQRRKSFIKKSKIYQLQNDLAYDNTYQGLLGFTKDVRITKYTHTCLARLLNTYNFSPIIQRLLKIFYRLVCIFIDPVNKSYLEYVEVLNYFVIQNRHRLQRTTISYSIRNNLSTVCHINISSFYSTYFVNWFALELHSNACRSPAEQLGSQQQDTSHMFAVKSHVQYPIS